MTIAISLLDAVSQEMTHAKAEKVLSLTLSIGKLSGVVPDALEFAFTELVKDHPGIQGVQMIFEHVKLKIHCHQCGIKSILEDIILICPECAGMSIEIMEGKQIQIREMEVI